MALASDSSVIVIAAAMAGAVGIAVARRIGRGQRRRGGSALGLFALTVILSALSLVAGAASVASLPLWLHQASIATLILGLVALGGVIGFDVVLARFGVEAPSILRDLVQTLVAAVLMLTFLRMAGLDVLPVITTSAVLTAVVGFALQTTIANLFGGMALQVDRTLSVGDWISAGGHVGRIEEIGWRSTRVVTKDGDTVFVPNGQLVAGEVLNFSRPNEYHRMWIRVGFHYRHPPNLVRQVLMDALHGTPGVVAHPSPDCVLTDFADSAVVYAVRFWISNFEQDVAIESDVRARLWYAARRAGLQIPYPIQTMVTEDPILAFDADAEQAARVTLLAGIGLFAQCEQTIHHRLADGMQRVEFGAGETIVSQGDAGDSLFLLQRGRVDVRLTVGDSTRELAVLGPGECFGERSLMTGELRNATCVARTDAVCYVLDAATLRPVLTERPALADQLSRLLSARQMELEAGRKDLTAAERARAAENERRLSARIRGFFGLG